MYNSQLVLMVELDVFSSSEVVFPYTYIYVVSVPDRSALFFIIWTGVHVIKNRADRSGTETNIYGCPYSVLKCG